MICFYTNDNEKKKSCPSYMTRVKKSTSEQMEYASTDYQVKITSTLFNYSLYHLFFMVFYTSIIYLYNIWSKHQINQKSMIVKKRQVEYAPNR